MHCRRPCSNSKRSRTKVKPLPSLPKKQADQAQATATQAKATAAKATAAAAETQTQVANLPTKPTDKDGWYFRHKPGDALTFETPGGEITGYGNFDVSFDGASKSVTGTFSSPANTNGGGGVVLPNGNFGWMPDISTNLSYLGVRGFQTISRHGRRALSSISSEAGIDISATPGDQADQQQSQRPSQRRSDVGRNSFIGIQGDRWGAIKIGKTDAPYKNSTSRMNPFSGEWGDYGVIMGNTGGDNRVEFGTRVDHAIGTNPRTGGGLQWNVHVCAGSEPVVAVPTKFRPANPIAPAATFRQSGG